jgi:GntR family transcriptional regulator/MocR family aminotransferase
MAKQRTTFQLMLPPREGTRSALRWLSAALRTEILEGRLRPGARLPATRELAAQLDVSRGTVVSVFEELIAEGYLEGRVGSGTFVSKILPETSLFTVGPASRAQRLSRTRTRPRTISHFGRRVKSLAPYDWSPPRAFRTNQPAVDLFPARVWGQIAARRLRAGLPRLFVGCGPMGYPPLQQAIADYLRSSRGVTCAAEQVAIVSGVQEALDIVGRLFLNVGDAVCLENPGYSGAARVFEAFGARIHPVKVDAEGMEVPRRNSNAVRVVYVTPAHQFPLGTAMTLSRRLELLQWARRCGALLFEDDYDSEFRYCGRPIPALQGLDRHGLVCFCGSFSKVLFPSIRLGYLVVPPDLVDYVAATKSITNRHAPLLEQVVLCDFMSEGHFGRHVRRMREIYSERLQVLLECARERLTGLLEISEIEAGLQTVGWLPDGIDAETAAKAAARRGIEVTALTNYYRGRTKGAGLQLGFAAVDTQEIRRGIRELAIALEGSSRSSGAARALTRY